VSVQPSHAITRKSASNLALAFVLLPKTKREGMSALYAFCREVDDVADETTAPLERRRARLAEWRADIARACAGERPQLAVNQDLQPVIARYHLPLALFEELIRGVEMDLDIQRYQTQADLELYCYRVASVVGLLSIEIFGYENAACREYALYLGKALQLTNILRDVRTDAERGRIYLPLEALERFKVRETEILQGRYSPQFRELAGSLAAQARQFYTRARQTLPDEDRRSMVAAELMGSVYWRLLGKLARRQFQVFGPQPVRLSKAHKALLIARAWWRMSTGARGAEYG